MNTKATCTILWAFLLLTINLYSQAPLKFNYQAVVRDDAGDLVSDLTIGIRISILQGSVEGTVVYSETHSPITDQFGLVTLEIGTGTVVSGELSTVDWGSYTYFLKVELDPTGGTTYTEMGTSQLLSVPYALHASAIDTPMHKLGIVEGEISDPEEALFEVKRNDGQTVFAVYPEGVRIYVEESTAKGSKGGFAVGGFRPAKGITNEFLRITPDSVRVYINDEISKGTKGGFAVGGYSPTKGATREFLRVTDDSTRVYVDNVPTKGTKGGFAVGGFNGTKAVPDNFLNLTHENYLIGQNAGELITTGVYNAFFGYEAGKNMETGDDNVFLGHQSGYSNNSRDNVMIGNRSGYFNTGYNNIFIGYEAGRYSNSTTNTTFIGNYAGYNMVGDDNIAIGDNAGRDMNIEPTTYECFGTVVLGIDAGRNFAGSDNTFLGYGSGSRWGGTSGLGNSNTFVGAGAGSGSVNMLGSGNVCLGYRAGNGKSGDNKLYIANNSTTTLIYGEFDNDLLVFNAMVGIGTTSPQGSLDVNGSIYQRGGVLHADYVFEDVYELESIEEHSEFMWLNKHLRAVPKAMKDKDGNDIVEWGARSRGILEELEKAHVYIDQLNSALKEQQKMIENQQQEIVELKDLVNKLLQE
ncbi:MAG: hypothetical protein JSV24_08205 [Bacteroidales bacterium]|nr:MAG: hypothetical protein JSV24_08205 [Bacteroidales bacterium]